MNAEKKILDVADRVFNCLDISTKRVEIEPDGDADDNPSGWVEFWRDGGRYTYSAYVSFWVEPEGEVFLEIVGDRQSNDYAPF